MEPLANRNGKLVALFCVILFIFSLSQIQLGYSMPGVCGLLISGLLGALSFNRSQPFGSHYFIKACAFLPLAGCVFQTFHPYLISVSIGNYDLVKNTFIFRILLIIASTVFLARNLFSFKRLSSTGMDFFLMGFAFFILASIPNLSPLPPIDVYTSNTLASQAILNGLNPYTIDYPDIYQGAYDYKPGFAYLPGFLIFSVPGLVLGDIRYGLIFSFSGSCLLLRAIGIQRGLSPKQATDMGLTYIFTAPSFFIVNQSFVDPAMAFFFLFGVYCWINGKNWQAGALLALCVCAKQTGILYVFGLLLIILRHQGKTAFFKILASFCFTALVCLSPFLILSPNEFIRSTILPISGTRLRADSANLVGYFVQAGQTTVAHKLTILGPLFYLFMVTTAFLRKLGLGDRLYLLAIGILLFHLFSRQAFVNYYFSILILFFLSLQSSGTKFGSTKDI